MSGFWQMPLHSDSVPKTTAFTLPGQPKSSSKGKNTGYKGRNQIFCGVMRFLQDTHQGLCQNL
jgi:hypothetical protein